MSERLRVKDSFDIIERHLTVAGAGGAGDGGFRSAMPEEEAPADETNEEVTAEEETPAEEVSEEVVEEVPSEESNDLTERLTALEAKVEELIAIVEKLVEKSETDSNAVEERLSKIEKMSAAKPVEEELEITKTSRKTGDAKMDARIAKPLPRRMLPVWAEP